MSVSAAIAAWDRRLLAREIDTIADTLVVDISTKMAFDLIDAKRDAPVVAGHLRRVLGAVWDRALDTEHVPDGTPDWWRQILRGNLPSMGKTINGRHVGAGKRVLSEPELKIVLPFLPETQPMNA